MTRRAVSLLAVFIIGLACAGLSLTLAPAPAYAAKQEGLSPPVHDLLVQVEDAMKAGNWADALAKAKQAQALPTKTPFDDFTINEELAKIYINTQDYTDAAIAYEAAWNSGFVKPEDKGTFLNGLAQIFFETKDYDKSLNYANQYFKEVGDNLDLEAIVCNIYYIQKNDAKAFATAQDLMSKAKLTGTQPKEPWLRLLLVTASAVNNADGERDALFGLVENYPDSDNWHDLAGNFYNVANKSDHYGLMCLRLMAAADAIKQPEEYLAMAQLALNVGLGGEAKQALEAGDASHLLPGNEKTLEQTLKTQIAAAVKGEPASLDAKDQQAAASKSGGSDIAIGEAFASYGEYDKAIAAVQRGLDMPASLKVPDDARLALGWVYFKAGQMDQAKSTFESIKTDQRSMNVAKGWLDLIKQKTSPPSAPAPAGSAPPK